MINNDVNNDFDYNATPNMDKKSQSALSKS